MTDKHYRGSKQYYQEQYADCMAMCNELGDVDLLLTYTMDPSAPEVQEMIPEKEKWQDHPPCLLRLFVDKLEEFEKNDIGGREILGPVSGWFRTIEHQKRFRKFIIVL